MKLINGVKYYKPSEVAKLGLITNSKGKSDYTLIHKLINRGELNAIILNKGKGIEYKLISETDIAEYYRKLLA